MRRSLGTRVQQNFSQIRSPSCQPNGRFAGDVGMNARIVGAITLSFTAPTTINVPGAAGVVAKFPVGMRIMVDGSNLNDGEHMVQSADATHIFVYAPNGVKTEGAPPVAGSLPEIRSV